MMECVLCLLDLDRNKPICWIVRPNVIQIGFEEENRVTDGTIEGYYNENASTQYVCWNCVCKMKRYELYDKTCDLCKSVCSSIYDECNEPRGTDMFTVFKTGLYCEYTNEFYEFKEEIPNSLSIDSAICNYCAKKINSFVPN